MIQTQTIIFSEFKKKKKKQNTQTADMVGKVTRKTAEKLGLENGEKIEKKKRGPRKRNPNSVLRRNARERDRIRNVNDAFDSLRSHVPNGDLVKGRKISKVETLKSAIEYIHALKDILGDQFEPIDLDDIKSDSDDTSDDGQSQGDDKKQMESQVESPESGIHSNETSLDYSLKSTTPSLDHHQGQLESIINHHDLPELPAIDANFFAGQAFPSVLPLDQHQPITSSPCQAPSVANPIQPSFGSEFDSYDFISHQNFLLENGGPFNTLSFDL